MTESEDRADALFHALSDRTRRDILRRVLAGEHSVSTLAASYDMSFAAVQKHVAVLERAGLLTKRRVGREALATGDVTAVRSVASMLDELEAVWRAASTASTCCSRRSPSRPLHPPQGADPPCP